ncbi:hypothetical protein TWF970_006059 [Orbilia oligospora]|uniref:Uncharacterized protein n=1 Tax=Orbilia oligospora TaxID=2813651 RepID=A0A7C8REN2_ORBOL|nr:hypothetical protein TWF970_006059 [Orbilia oligospora]
MYVRKLQDWSWIDQPTSHDQDTHEYLDALAWAYGTERCCSNWPIAQHFVACRYCLDALNDGRSGRIVTLSQLANSSNRSRVVPL